jgi:hypothetical protein
MQVQVWISLDIRSQMYLKNALSFSTCKALTVKWGAYDL